MSELSQSEIDCQQMLIESANQIRDIKVNLNSFLTAEQEPTIKSATKLTIEGYLTLKVPSKDMPTPCYLKIEYLSNPN